MSRRLSISDALSAGLTMYGQRMPSGEMRALAANRNTSATVIDFPDGDPHWHPAHFHEDATERTMVLRGRAILALETVSGALLFKSFREGTSFQVPAGLAHSVFLTPGIEMVAIHSGSPHASEDRKVAKHLDRRLRGLTRAEIEAHLSS